MVWWWTSRWRFNPHPTRRPDAATGRCAHQPTPRRVSILTRPEGRMRQTRPSLAVNSTLFQSSPDPKAGCGPSRPGMPITRPGFNPHPTRRPDAAQEEGQGRPSYDVSILTRPEGRMRRRCPPTAWAGRPMFQSSPDPKAGCGPTRSALRTPSPRFNPHPTRRPDAAGGLGNLAAVLGFQSSPDPKAGCGSAAKYAFRASVSTFQSSPDPKAGCGSTTTNNAPTDEMFQSSPDPKAGCGARRKPTHTG